MEAKKNFVVHPIKGGNSDGIKKMEDTLFFLWGTGKSNGIVEFFPFVSYYGFEEEYYTTFMAVTVGYLCQVFFEQQKTPTKKQIMDIKKLLRHMGAVQFFETIGEVDGSTYVNTKTVQFVKCVFVSEVTTEGQISATMRSSDRLDFDNLRPTDWIEVAFFKPYFDKEVSLLNDN